MPNLSQPDWEERGGPPGYRAQRARIGCQLGSELLGASMWRLPPGEAAYPYHFHYADEEIVFVLQGRPTLRTPEGVRVLEEGEAVHFPLGEEGAHQIFNPTEEEVRFLAVSSHGRPDIVIFPDSGKVGLGERRPDGSGLREFFRREDAVDYWQDEQPPPAD